MEVLGRPGRVFRLFLLADVSRCYIEKTSVKQEVLVRFVDGRPTLPLPWLAVTTVITAPQWLRCWLLDKRFHSPGNPVPPRQQQTQPTVAPNVAKAAGG
jgi:hypothetical protein